MEKLGFTLPDFSRVVYTSEAVQKEWEPKIRAVSKAFQLAELSSIGMRGRRAAITSINPDALGEVSRYAAKRGLQLCILSQTGIPKSYSSTPTPITDGRWQYRIGLAIPSIADAFQAAFDKGDDIAVGDYLGFPSCCKDFFMKYWKAKGFVDTTIPMLENGMLESIEDLVINPKLGCNILLRNLGIRLVSHLPCNFSCQSTEYQAKENLEVIPEPERALLLEMLKWPLSWSGLHGIAEIKTPYFKIISRTDAYAKEIHFRLNQPESVRQVNDSFRSGSNGFDSLESMKLAHQMVLSEIIHVMTEQKIETVVDLGSGDGTLLEKVWRLFPKACVNGIEKDVAVYNKMTQRFNGNPDMHFVVQNSDIEKANLLTGEKILWLVSETRLNSFTMELIDKAQKKGTKVVLYNYSAMKAKQLQCST